MSKRDACVACQQILCSDVNDAGTGANIVVQRYEAYFALINFSNYFNDLYNTLFNAGTIGLGDTSTIVSTFFTISKPDVIRNEIVGLVPSFLGIAGAGFGAVKSVAGSTASGVISGILGSAASVQAANAGPVVDERFTEYVPSSMFPICSY